MNKKENLYPKGIKMNSKTLQKICIFLCLGGSMLLALTACSAKEAATQSASVTPVVADTNTVIASGHLVPLTSTWLSFQVSGRVQTVLVKEGDKVVKDQPLVQLEGSDRAEAELKAAQSALFLAQQNLNDAKNSTSLMSAAEMKLATAQDAYNTALSNYYDRNTAQGNAQQIALYQAKVILAQDKVDKAQDRVDAMGDYADTDVAKAKAIADLNQAKIDLENIKKTRNYYQNLPDNLDVQTFTAKLDAAKAALSDAQRDYDRLKDGPSKEALAGLQAAADSAQAAADDAQWAYDQLVLKAPYDGTFVQCGLTEGQFVAAGIQAALVADFSQWMIETDDLDEIQAAQIDISKPVSVTADALPGQEFTGTVDRVLQSYTDKNSDILYTAKIKLKPGSDKTIDAKLRWGMTMQVEFQK
jgi:HlyD family secretion protein